MKHLIRVLQENNEFYEAVSMTLEAIKSTASKDELSPVIEQLALIKFEMLETVNKLKVVLSYE